jgi:hypothetical protein
MKIFSWQVWCILYANQCTASTTDLKSDMIMQKINK